MLSRRAGVLLCPDRIVRIRNFFADQSIHQSQMGQALNFQPSSSISLFGHQVLFRWNSGFVSKLFPKKREALVKEQFASVREKQIFPRKFTLSCFSTDPRRFFCSKSLQAAFLNRKEQKGSGGSLRADGINKLFFRPIRVCPTRAFHPDSPSLGCLRRAGRLLSEDPGMLPPFRSKCTHSAH